MVYVVMGCLGIPIWLIVVAIVITLYSRYRVKKQLGMFPAKLRLESGAFPGVSEKWSSCYCVWDNEVLSMRKGMFLLKTVPLPVAAAEEAKRLGDKPMYLRFRLDDGSILQMSGYGDMLDLAQGPFPNE